MLQIIKVLVIMIENPFYKLYLCIAGEANNPKTLTCSQAEIESPQSKSSYFPTFHKK